MELKMAKYCHYVTSQVIYTSEIDESDVRDNDGILSERAISGTDNKLRWGDCASLLTR